MKGKSLYIFLLLMVILPFGFCDELETTGFSIILNKIGTSRIVFCEVGSAGVDEDTEINEVLFDSYITPNSGSSFSTETEFGIVLDLYPSSTSTSASVDVKLVFSCDSNYLINTGMLRGVELSSDNQVIFLNYDVAVEDEEGSASVKNITVSDDLSAKLSAGLDYEDRVISLLSGELDSNGIKKRYVCSLTINEGSGTDESSMIMDNVYSGLAILLVDVK